MSAATRYWKALAKAHQTQAEAHRLFAEAARQSGRSDESTLATIAHHDVQRGYSEKRAEEASAFAAWPATPLALVSEA